MRRREALVSLAAGALGAAACGGTRGKPASPPFAICNETFHQEPDLARACKLAHDIGYGGIELDPSTLAEDPTSLSASERAGLRRILEESGLRYLGLHNVLKSKSRRLHITTPDQQLRRESWDYFRRMVDLAADLGEEPVVVLGSGNQRSAVDGMSPADAVSVVAEGLATLAPHAEARGACILLEPLAPHQSNIFHTLAQTSAVVHAIGSPAIQTIFDTHNTAAETDSIEDLVRRYLPLIRHVHVNEMDGSYPGNGGYPFGRLLQALRESGYAHWVSVEVFQFKIDGAEMARRALRHLRHQLESAG